MNDSRGGDACGRIFSSEVQHGVDKLKLYKDFITEVENPIGLESTTVLGHCRKASVGGRESIYAQPIILRKKDINMKAIRDTILKKNIKACADNDIIFSGIHNGTISNYRIIATNYGIPTEDHNDSKVILTALFYGNYKVLLEYEGTAALVWHNHLTDKTYIFKGESKYSKASTIISEERPLHFYQVTPGNIYISSEIEPLLMINGTLDSVFQFEPNYIHIFKSGDCIGKEKYSRVDCVQSNYTYERDYVKYPAVKGYSKYPAEYYHKDLYDSYGYQEPKDKIPKSADLLLLDGGLSKIRLFNKLNQPNRIQAEKVSNEYSQYARRVIYNKSRYWMHSGLLHGTYIINQWGGIPTAHSLNTLTPKLYYFVEGIMMDGFKSYQEALKLHDSFIISINTNPDTIVDKEIEFIERIAPNSKYPVSSLLNMTSEQDTGWYGSTNVPYTYYSGSFTPTFSDTTYTFDKGDLMSLYKNVRGADKAIHNDDDKEMCDLYLLQCKDPHVQANECLLIGHDLIYKETDTNPLSPFQSIILSDTSAKDFNVLLAIIHYMRDFRLEVSNGCKKCPYHLYKDHINCVGCRRIVDEGYAIINEINYAVLDRK